MLDPKIIEDINQYILSKYSFEDGYTFMIFCGKKSNKNDFISGTHMVGSLESFEQIFKNEFVKMSILRQQEILNIIKESILFSESFDLDIDENDNNLLTTQYNENYTIH